MLTSNVPLVAFREVAPDFIPSRPFRAVQFPTRAAPFSTDTPPRRVCPLYLDVNRMFFPVLLAMRRGERFFVQFHVQPHSSLVGVGNTPMESTWMSSFPPSQKVASPPPSLVSFEEVCPREEAPLPSCDGVAPKPPFFFPHDNPCWECFCFPLHQLHSLLIGFRFLS